MEHLKDTHTNKNNLQYIFMSDNRINFIFKYNLNYNLLRHRKKNLIIKYVCLLLCNIYLMYYKTNIN